MRRWSIFVFTLVLFLLLPFMAQILPAAGQVTSSSSTPLRLQSPASGQKAMGAQEETLRDIKDPLLIKSINPVLIWIGGGVILALLLLGGLLWWWLKKRGRQQNAVLAHETALTRLDEARVLMDTGQACAFAALIADILRDYIEARFFLSAHRQTTREFISNLTDGTRPVPPELAGHDQDLRIWLELCDLAKFACCAPSVKTMREMEDAVRNFVVLTRLQENKK